MPTFQNNSGSKIVEILYVLYHSSPSCPCCYPCVAQACPCVAHALRRGEFLKVNLTTKFSCLTARGQGASVSACTDLTNQLQCCWVDPACA